MLACALILHKHVSSAQGRRHKHDVHLNGTGGGSLDVEDDDLLSGKVREPASPHSQAGHFGGEHDISSRYQDNCFLTS
jgi:hypothetical protein